MKHAFLIRLAAVIALVTLLLTGIVLIFEGYFSGQQATIETGELFIMGATIITVAWSGWESLRAYADSWDEDEHRRGPDE